MSKINENVFSYEAWKQFLQEYKESEETDFESDSVKVENKSIANCMEYRTLVLINIDKSESMKKFSKKMNMIIKTIKDTLFYFGDLINIQISKTLFASYVQPERYMDLQNFNFSADYFGNTHSTKLYDSIIDSEHRINRYKTELMNRGVNVISILFILSDGKDNGSISDLQEARDSLKRMQDDDSNIVIFVNFNGENGKDIADSLNIDKVIDYKIGIHELAVYTKFVSSAVIKRSQGEDK